MIERPTEQDLNAYVDSELSPQDDARVAQAIAQDPKIAARVATLTRLKSALSSLANDVPSAPALPDSRRSTGWLGIAASVGLLIAVGAAMLTGLTRFGQDDDGWYREALAGHTDWARDPSLPDAREVDANLFLASVERFGLPVQTPDLTSASLRLTYLRYLAATETAAATARGSRPTGLPTVSTFEPSGGRSASRSTGSSALATAVPQWGQ